MAVFQNSRYGKEPFPLPVSLEPEKLEFLQSAGFSGCRCENEKFMEKLIRNVQLWLEDAHEEEEKKRVLWLTETLNYNAVDDAFFKHIGFGSRGMRGKSGIGINRMNAFTVARVAQAFARFLQMQYPGQELSVALAYDNRKESCRFSQLAAGTFSANGIQVYYFDILTPAPVLAYSLPLLGCVGGMMLSAGPASEAYNGIELFDLTGSLLPKNSLVDIESYMDSLTRLEQLPLITDTNLVEFIPEKIEQYYLESLARTLQEITETYTAIHYPIVYSPLHGTGTILGPAALAKMGVQALNPVDEEFPPFSDFGALSIPDCQSPEALVAGIREGKRRKTGLVLATDPDGGRAGVAIQDKDQTFVPLAGHEIALLVLDYLIQVRKKDRSRHLVVLRDVRTSRLLEMMCEVQGLKCFTTSFGERGKENLLLRDGGRMLLAIDREYGMYFPRHVPERDGFAAAGFMAQAYNFWLSKGIGLADRLMEIYMTYGCYTEYSFSMHIPGHKGPERIKEKFALIRECLFSGLPGFEVLYRLDYSGEGTTAAERENRKYSQQSREERLHIELKGGYQLEVSVFPEQGKIDYFLSGHRKVTSLVAYTEAKEKMEMELGLLRLQI